MCSYKCLGRQNLRHFFLLYYTNVWEWWQRTGLCVMQTLHTHTHNLISLWHVAHILEMQAVPHGAGCTAIQIETKSKVTNICEIVQKLRVNRCAHRTSWSHAINHPQCIHSENRHKKRFFPCHSKRKKKNTVVIWVMVAKYRYNTFWF